MASGCSDVVIRHDRADILEDPILDRIPDLSILHLRLDSLHKILVVHRLMERREENPLLSAQLLVLTHHSHMVVEINIRDAYNGQGKRRRRVGLAGSRRPLQNDILLALQQLRGLCNHPCLLPRG